MRNYISSNRVAENAHLTTIKSLFELHDPKVRDEFAYEAAKFYTVRMFRQVRRESTRFGAGKFSQGLLGRISAIAATWLSAFESGKVPNPGLKTLVKIAGSLGCCLEIRLVPFSHYLKMNAGVVEPSYHVLSYEEEVNLQSKSARS